MRARSFIELSLLFGLGLLGPGCDDPPPLGPDLVACHCSCFTQTRLGTTASSNACGNSCTTPCPSQVAACRNTGGCGPTCSPNVSPTFSNSGGIPQVGHVCVESSNATDTQAACADRCADLASGSVVDCVGGLLSALGFSDELHETLPDDFADRITPNAAQSAADLIVEECGTWLIDKLTGTCGSSLLDLVLCAISIGDPQQGSGPTSIRSCFSTVDPVSNTNYQVRQINGCPQFAGGAEPTPMGGSQLPGDALIMPTMSMLTISGQDVSTTSSAPSGTARSGRLGPLFLLGEMRVDIPTVNLTVKGNAATLTQGFFLLRAPVAAVITEVNNSPTFTIPAGKFRGIVTGSLAGTIMSVEAVNATAMVGLYDEDAALFQLTGSVVLQTIGATVQMQLGLDFANRPPLVDIGPDQTIECTSSTREGTVALSAGSSMDPDAGDQIAKYTWTIGAQLVAQGPSVRNVSARVGLGTRVASLTTVDTRGSTSRDTALVKVVDTKKPVFGTLPTTASSVCDPGSQSATIIPPSVTDACDPGVVVTGAIITRNGQTLPTPIPLQNGSVQLPLGTHVVRWTARDQSGNTATATQTIAVRPGIVASSSVAIEDRGELRLPGGGFATLGNTGNGLTSGVQAQTGSIITKGGVFLRDRAIVNGNILAGGAVTTQNLTTVTGTVTQNSTSVILPAGRDLSGVVFPASNAGAVTLPPDGTRSLAPGSYGMVTASSRAVLTLSAGTYYFQSLTLEPQSRLHLNQAGGPVKLYVKNSMIVRGQIASIAGAPDGFVLGFAGTGSVVLETPFPGGTVIAPSAGVVIASLGTNAFRGQLFAKDIQVRPQAVVTCIPIPGF
jgi:hypothetical protein